MRIVRASISSPACLGVNGWRRENLFRSFNQIINSSLTHNFIRLKTGFIYWYNKKNQGLKHCNSFYNLFGINVNRIKFIFYFCSCSYNRTHLINNLFHLISGGKHALNFLVSTL